MKKEGFFSKYLLPLIIVPKCVSCFSVIPSDKEALCDKCRHIYQLESKLACSVCGRAHTHCICRIVFEDVNIPLFHCTGYNIKRNAISKNIVLHIKDSDYPVAFDMIAREMAEVLKLRLPLVSQEMLSEAVITWIPRSGKAKRKAGHDQSQKLAQRISEITGARLVQMFENHSAASQKTLDRSMRKQNAKKNYVFCMENPEIIRNRQVIIVDDIVTTGASIGACAELLRAAQVKHIAALVYAKTDNKRGANEETVDRYLR